MKTYPKMNETVKDLLRRSNEPMSLYILTWLEELENRVQELTPPNAPLTLEELREMDGEPVYLIDKDEPIIKEWVIWDKGWTSNWFEDAKNYGKTWLAYRRKPEEGTP